MPKDIREKVLDSMMNDELYGFISENYYDMPREVLKDIILELDFARYQAETHFIEYYEMVDYAMTALKERWSLEDYTGE